MISNTYKITLVGNTAVGKSSLIHYYIKGHHPGNNAPTVGASFHRQRLNVDDKIIDLNIWDTAGQERYRAIGTMYYRDADACICLLDLTQTDAIKSAESWINNFKKAATNPDSVIILVANKCDISETLWTVSKEEVESYAIDNDYPCIFTSSLTGEGIEKLFNTLGQYLVKIEKNAIKIPGAKTDAKNRSGFSLDTITEKAWNNSGKCAC